MIADKCYTSLSKGQLINLLRDKAEKNYTYKRDKLLQYGADLDYLKTLFSDWKTNEIESLLTELLSY